MTVKEFVEITKIFALRNNWPKVSRPNNGSIGELYLRVTMPTNCGSRTFKSGDWNHGPFVAIHHSCLASITHEDILRFGQGLRSCDEADCRHLGLDEIITDNEQLIEHEFTFR